MDNNFRLKYIGGVKVIKTKAGCGSCVNGSNTIINYKSVTSEILIMPVNGNIRNQVFKQGDIIDVDQATYLYLLSATKSEVKGVTASRFILL